jgi:hypothetical protein
VFAPVKFTESLENPRGIASALACPANQTVHAHELFGSTKRSILPFGKKYGFNVHL